MDPQQNATSASATEAKKAVVNDFVITFSTVNGSGSATANGILLRSLFKMGIPVSGKNIFPSNIQGLPTWYSIRLSKDGYVARVERDDIVVAMNPATIAREQEFLVPGGVLFYSDEIKVSAIREDIIAYPMPIKKLVREADAPQSLRDYLANMAYVGVVAQMIGIPLDHIYKALDYHFKGKKKPIDSNFAIIKAGAEWAAVNLDKRDPYHVEPMNGTEGFIMSDGNTAGALGSIYGGVQFVAWYPITPASSLAETLHETLPSLRTDPETGKQTFVVVQAEDELAAVGMAVGAGWSGVRAMTSTSGPGVSLMSEYLGLAYYAEIPVVVWDVQRVGPSTGMPTRTMQGDITQVYFHSQGDKNFIMLLPGSVNECFEFGWKAFDLAEHFQTPVMVMSDLDLGMNQWMTPKFVYPDKPMDRGKILWEEDLEKLLKERNGDWGRYLDIDGDGIGYRTVMGNRHPRSAYFSRGTGHDEYARYSEDPVVWERLVNRLGRKVEGARAFVPKPEISTMEGAKIGIISYGSADPAVVEARDQMKLMGIATDYMRLRGIPFSPEVKEFIASHERVYVVEINRDGQMKQLLTLEAPELATHLRKAAHVDGLALSAKWVRETILAQEESEK